jgi:hypothetical protein
MLNRGKKALTELVAVEVEGRAVPVMCASRCRMSSSWGSCFCFRFSSAIGAFIYMRLLYPIAFGLVK